MEYFYNVHTKLVEEGRCSDARYLMGPYPTRRDAEQALEKAAARTEQWDEEDAEWDDASS